MTVQAACAPPAFALPVRDLGPAELKTLAADIRAFLVEKVCATGGHLGVNLGVVELTIALHRVFDSPRDVILFDTGHQAYVHKILTGRAGQFGTLRQSGGLSGYPSRAESPHDWIENSHASTALAYADGIAKAFRLTGDRTASEANRRHVVAVIGDGAMTGGLAWEGLNNLAHAPDRPVTIVLNDNGRSYQPTIGGLAYHLSQLRGGTPGPRQTVFEQLGLAYVGPVDGHDLTALHDVLSQAKSLNRTVVVHAITDKGHGWHPAETDETDRMHGIGVLDPATGRPRRPGPASWTTVFGEHLAEIGARHPEVVAITAAMLHPVGLTRFAERFPDRTFDVGIAEQQAVCSAAGMAMAGLHPVVALYATFLNRAFDQVLMDVALHKLPVTFVLDRAGITGPDGASHHGMWDLALLSAVPGMRVAAPRDTARLRELLDEAIGTSDGPTAIRFPKASAGPGIPAAARIDGIDVLHRGTRRPLDVLIVAAGTMAQPAVEAARLLEATGTGVTVIDPRWLLPVHPTVVHLIARHRLAVVIEDARRGGLSAAVTAACADATVSTPVQSLGLPAAFIGHAERDQLLRDHQLTGPGCAQAVLNALRAGSPDGSTL
jgi:1-deoxy-D-xylulose-5-phosphate synthase